MTCKDHCKKHCVCSKNEKTTVKRRIKLYPEIVITHISDDILPLGMIYQDDMVKFDGGAGGKQGNTSLELFESKKMKIRVKEIKNITIIIFIKHKSGKEEEIKLSNVKSKKIEKKIHKGDIVYFGYLLNQILVPVYDLKIYLR